MKRTTRSKLIRSPVGDVVRVLCPKCKASPFYPCMKFSGASVDYIHSARRVRYAHLRQLGRTPFS